MYETYFMQLCTVKQNYIQSMKYQLMKKTFFIILLILFSMKSTAGIIQGIITDKQTKEALTGATIQITGTNLGTVADINGHYQFNVKDGTYVIEVKYMGYKSIIKNDIPVLGNATVNFMMEANEHLLNSVTVVGQKKQNTVISQISDQRRSLVVQSGVSAQQISKTADKDASEVIRRVPGVSIINEKFVMVRGLSQRYNNVWINGSAVPSSEANTRAFSFDIIPSSQLDNIIIIKSPTPEYPADFTGGFILLNTKDMPSKNSLNISVGTSINDKTHFNNFYHSKNSPTDFLGFDSGMRSLNAGMKGALNTYTGTNNISILNNGLNNDWKLRTIKPWGDLKLSVSYNHRWDTQSGRQYGLLAALNYSNTYKTYLNMDNSLYGVYDTTNDRPVYMRKSVDNQYSNNNRIGGMINFTFQPKNKHNRYELKNIFNQIGKNQYTERHGFNAQNDSEHNMEYNYSSRTTYNGQLTGKHTFDKDQINWSMGFAYANHNLPDRKRIELNDRTNETMGLYNISREFTELNEYISSANINYRHDFIFGLFTPTLKAGAYGEYRTRTYNTRQFNYTWNPTNTTLPSNFQFSDDPVNDILIENNYGANKLYMLEQVDKTNDYNGKNTQVSGYIGLNFPMGVFNIYAGTRYEYNRMELIMNTRSYEDSPRSTYYNSNNLFPSVNATYKLTKKQQLRFSYGKSINRPEFRELSSSVFYDFDLASDIMGNSSLKPCHIDNIDFRYEWYPNTGELITLALFYKNFKDPIEWTYTVTGGTDLVYSYRNARGAENYGIELDLRKKLDFIGLKNFSWSFNGSLIKSRVKFPSGSQEKNRTMQGQSPYLVNTGIFYRNDKSELNISLLYNRIGKRIVGVGRSIGATGVEDSKTIPNSYEMPRNTFDFSISKEFNHWNLKASVRDILAEKVIFKQLDDVLINGTSKSITEITKQYKPGRNFDLTVSYRF